jgi:hypothetical protein
MFDRQKNDQMEVKMTELGLQHLVENLDRLILQHLNYLNRLDDAIKKKAQFAHKQPTDCDFGKLFYAEVWPGKDKYSAPVQESIARIEQEHRTFHAMAGKVDPTSTSVAALDDTLACWLVLHLYDLEKQLKEK